MQSSYVTQNSGVRITISSRVRHLFIGFNTASACKRLGNGLPSACERLRAPASAWGYRVKDKPKLFYSYVRNKQKVKRVIPQLNTGAGIITSSDEEIAQELDIFLDRFSQGKMIMKIIIQNSKAECTEIISCKMLYLPRTMYVKVKEVKRRQGLWS